MPKVQDHETRDLSLIYSTTHLLAHIRRPDTINKLMYGNSNVVYRTLQQINDAIQATWNDYEGWGEYQQTVAEFALMAFSRLSPLLAHSLTAQGRNDLQRLAKAFRWIPLQGLLQIINDQQRMKRHHTASHLSTQILQNHSTHYRGIDGAMSIGHWFPNVRKIIQNAMKLRKIDHAEIDTLEQLIRYLEKQSINTRSHVEFFCYIPSDDNEQLVPNTNRFTPITIH